MIITDYNEMSLTELSVINYALGIEFEINNGKITYAVNGGNENE